ncbi:MAG: hypothetical protein AAGG75_14815 [Bacteroidota bacterium]
MKLNSLFIITLLFLLGCSKSEEIETKNISGSEAFHSITLSDNFNGTHLKQPISELDFNHYLVMERFKMLQRPVEAFSKIVYAKSIEEGLDLAIGETQISSVYDFIAYNFSNDWSSALSNGIETDSLPENDFSKIPFTFTVNEDLSFEGFFPEPGQLSTEQNPAGIGKRSKSEGIELAWAPSVLPNSKIRIGIYHSSTVDTSASELAEVQELIVDDTGNTTLPTDVLSPYFVGDEIIIDISRDIFLLEDDILIRGLEHHSLGFITLLD